MTTIEPAILTPGSTKSDDRGAKAFDLLRRIVVETMLSGDGAGRPIISAELMGEAQALVGPPAPLGPFPNTYDSGFGALFVEGVGGSPHGLSLSCRKATYLRRDEVARLHADFGAWLKGRREADETEGRTDWSQHPHGGKTVRGCAACQ